MGTVAGSRILTSVNEYFMSDLSSKLSNNIREVVFSPRGSWAITGCVYEGQKPMVRISTNKGYSIIVSQDQLFADSYELLYNGQKAIDLRVGGTVCIIETYGAVENDTITNIEDMGNLNSYNLIIEDNHPYRASHFVLVPIIQPITPTKQNYNSGSYPDLM